MMNYIEILKDTYFNFLHTQFLMRNLMARGCKILEFKCKSKTLNETVCMTCGPYDCIHIGWKRFVVLVIQRYTRSSLSKVKIRVFIKFHEHFYIHLNYRSIYIICDTVCPRKSASDNLNISYARSTKDF